MLSVLTRATTPNFAAMAAALALGCNASSAQERPDITAKQIVEALADYFDGSCYDPGYVPQHGNVCEVAWFEGSAVVRSNTKMYADEPDRPDREVFVLRIYPPDLYFCEGPDSRVACTTIVGRDSARYHTYDDPSNIEPAESHLQFQILGDLVLQRQQGTPYSPESSDPAIYRFNYDEAEMGIIFSIENGAANFLDQCSTPRSIPAMQEAFPACTE